MYGQICFTLGFFWFAVLNLPGSLVVIGFFHVFFILDVFYVNIWKVCHLLSCGYVVSLRLLLCPVQCTVDILFLRGMRNVTQLFVLLEDGLTNKQLGNLHSYIRYQIRCMALFLSDDFHRI